MLTKLRNKKILGFTAIEISMVATVIAILALLILPLFRKRSEDAKKVAANDDLQSLMKALILANADTDQWFRLQDLDNTSQYNQTPLDSGTEVPVAYWNKAISVNERQSLATPERWQGPYIAYAKGSRYNFIYYSNAIYAKPFLFKEPNVEGPIFNGPYLIPDTYGSTLPPDDDKLPKDPWGNPYLFFGPGNVTWGQPAAQTTYGHAVIYCLGPNGFPGNNELGASTASSYFRYTGFPSDPNLLGNGDDFFVIF